MLGQKIVQVYSDDLGLHDPSSNALPQQTGLRVRRPRPCKSPGLRIITEDQASMPLRVSQLSAFDGDYFSDTQKKRTNSVELQLSALDYTPNTCHTFGIPNPSNRRPNVINSSALSSRRHSRYTYAEQSLISRFSKQSSTEPSPEELKIRALEDVAANLSAYARDAQENVALLRQKLADRSIEPESYRSLQKERWREERRRVIMEQRAKDAQQQLKSLSQPRPPISSKQCVLDRRQANLVSFFDRSPTKASLHFKSSPSFQTKMMSELSPLSLRPPVPLPPTPLEIKAMPRAPLYARRHQPEKSITTAIIETPVSITRSVSTATTTETESASMSSLPTLDDDDEIFAPGEGFASIYSPTFFGRRTKAEIMAELGEIAIPAYAKDLLEDLDYIFDEISLSSELGRPQGNQITFSNPTPSTPSDPPTPKPSERSTAQVKPFSSPAKYPHTPQSLISIPESSPSSSVRVNRRHTPAVSMGSFFHKEQENDMTKADTSPNRHSLHAPAPTLAPTSRSKGLLRKKSATMAVVSETPPSPSPTPEFNLQRRSSRANLVSRIRRPFSMLVRS